MKRFVCLLLALIMVVGILPATASAASERSTSDNAANLLAQFEGFEAEEYTSGGKSYIGYGTEIKAGSYPNGITESKAREIMKTYLKDTVDEALNEFTETNNLDLSQHQHDALAIFSYSFGTAWLKGNGPLRKAVLAGTTGNDFINALAQSHGGTPNMESQYFKGMMNRRLAEANLYLNGQYSKNAPSNYTYVVFDMDGDEKVAANDLVRAYDAKTYPLITEKPELKQGEEFLGWYLQEDMIYDWFGVHVGSPVTYLSSETAGKVLVARISETDKESNTYYTINTNTLLYREVFSDDLFDDSSWLGKWIESMLGNLDAPYFDYEDQYGLKMENLVIGTLKKGTDFTVTKETQVSGIKWLYGTGTNEKGKKISGWIYYGGLPEELPKEDTAIATATAFADINVREGATVDSNIVKVNGVNQVIKNGQTVKLYEIKQQQTETGNKNWGKIKITQKVNGKEVVLAEGWINLAYAEIDAVENGDNLGSVGTTGTIVNTDYVNVRKGAGVDKAQITQLPRGTKVFVVETKTVNGAQWGKVKWEGLIGGYTEGWVYMYYVQLNGSLNGSTGSDNSYTTNEPILYTGVVTSNINLNVRKKADVYSDKVDSLPNGTKINIYEVKTKDNMKWGRIGENRWVCLAYVSLTEVSQNSGNSGSTATTTSIQATVTSNTLDVFLNYNSNSEKVGSLKKGDVVTILERNTENTETGSRIWGRISKNGLAGWINLAYVELKTVTSVGGSTGSNTGTTGSNAAATGEGIVYNCISLNVRESAGTGSNIVMKLPANTRVTVYEQITFQNAPWARIKWNNGANEGWACMYYISLSSTSNGTTGSAGSTTNGTTNGTGSNGNNTVIATGVVNSNIDLNVRAGAGMNYGKIGSLAKGTGVSIYEQVTADGMIWGRINYGSTTGWICMSYITVDSAASSTGRGVMGTIARCFSHVNVRSAPGTNNALLTTIPVGTRVEVFEQQMYSNQYWGRVAQGWICMDYVLLDSELPPGVALDATQPTTAPTTAPTQASGSDVTINTKNEVPYVIKGTSLDVLNVRNDADVDSIKVGTLNQGTTVTIHAVKNNNAELWGRIDEYATAGWINMANVAYSVVGYVNTDEQPVYVNADTDSMVKGNLNLNTELTITKLNTDNDIVYGWVESGINGWIPMSRISAEPVDAIPVYKSSTDSFGTNRTEGTTTMAISAYDAVNSSKVVFKLKQGVKVYVGDLKIEAGIVWGKLTANGTIGWINMGAVNYVINGGAVATELNVRTAKNTTDPDNILGTLAAGADISVCELGFDAYGNLWAKVYNCNSNTDLNGGYVMIRNTSGAYNVNGIF